MTTELPPELIAAETAAWTEIQTGTLTVPTALAVHQAVTAHAEASGMARLAVEEAVKRAVRHGEPAA